MEYILLLELFSHPLTLNTKIHRYLRNPKSSILHPLKNTNRCKINIQQQNNNTVNDINRK